VVVVGWTVNDAEDGIDEGIVSTVTAFLVDLVCDVVVVRGPSLEN